MKEKIGKFFGNILGYLIVANVLFAIPVTVYLWYTDHKKIKNLDERVDYIYHSCDIPVVEEEEE